jgi:hypothetical protein
MPRIPLYNQGLGPSVEMATGQLSPRASAQAMSAPGQAMAGLGRVIQQTAQVGAKFEMERQKRQADDVLLSLDSEFTEAATDLNRQQQLRDIGSYRSAFDEMQTNYLSRVDQMTNLNAGQKSAIKANLARKGNIFRASGTEQAHSFYLQDATANFNKAANSSIKLARVDGSFIPIEIARYEVDYENAERQGLKPALNPQQFAFSIYRERVSDFSQDEAQTLKDLQEEKKRIERGDGEYERFSESENQSLARILDNRISFLTGEALIDASNQFDDATASMVAATTPEDFATATNNASDAVAAIARAGNTKLATELDTKLFATQQAIDVRNDLVFADSEQVRGALQTARKEARDAINTDRAYEASLALQETEKLLAKRQQAITEDPALYVTSEYQRLNNAVPSQLQIMAKQRQMGIGEAQIKVLTKTQIQDAIEQVNQAQTPEEASRIFAALAQTEQTAPFVMRQIMGSGMSLAANYVANLPASPIAGKLLNSSRPNAMTVAVGAPVKQDVRSAVVTNDVVVDHLHSLLGSSFADFNNNEIMGAASDSLAMDMARQSHITMIEDLTLYLMQEKGKILAGTDRVGRDEIEKYVEQAATVLSERYAYINNFPNTQTALRLPAWRGAKQREIRSGLERFAENLSASDVYYESRAFEPADARFELEKEVYVSEVRDFFGWVASNDGNSAFLVDKTGGLVFKEITVDGRTELQPISVTFDEALGQYEEVLIEKEEAKKMAEPYLGMIGG